MERFCLYYCPQTCGYPIPPPRCRGFAWWSCVVVLRGAARALCPSPAIHSPDINLLLNWLRLDNCLGEVVGM